MSKINWNKVPSGTRIKLNPQEISGKVILEKLLADKVNLTLESYSDGLINFKANNIIWTGYFAKRFLLADPKNKHKEILDKIKYLNTRYQERNAHV